MTLSVPIARTLSIACHKYNHMNKLLSSELFCHWTKARKSKLNTIMTYSAHDPCAKLIFLPRIFVVFPSIRSAVVLAATKVSIFPLYCSSLSSFDSSDFCFFFFSSVIWFYVLRMFANKRSYSDIFCNRWRAIHTTYHATHRHAQTDTPFSFAQSNKKWIKIVNQSNRDRASESL